MTLEESTTPAVGRLRRPERVRTSPRTVVGIRAQVPPRRPGAQHVQHGVEVFALPVRRARPPTARMLGYQEAGDARPGGVEASDRCRRVRWLWVT